MEILPPTADMTNLIDHRFKSGGSKALGRDEDAKVLEGKGS